MTKTQALYQFFNSFGLPAYDVTSIPTGENSPEMPYITYNTAVDCLDAPYTLTVQVWYRTTSWTPLSDKTAEIAKKIATMLPIKIDDGYIYVTRGTPFAQRMADGSDSSVKRMVLNITVEYLTAY